jgi:hypothetical protein
MDDSQTSFEIVGELAQTDNGAGREVDAAAASSLVRAEVERIEGSIAVKKESPDEELPDFDETQTGDAAMPQQKDAEELATDVQEQDLTAADESFDPGLNVLPQIS